MEYKKEILIDLYNLDLTLDFKQNKLTWNVNDVIILTLKTNVEVLEY